MDQYLFSGEASHHQIWLSVFSNLRRFYYKTLHIFNLNDGPNENIRENDWFSVIFKQ